MPISIGHAGVGNTGRWTPTPHWDWGDNRTAVHLMLIPGSTPDNRRIGYTIQWFSFAAILLGGSLFLARARSRAPRANGDGSV